MTATSTPLFPFSAVVGHDDLKLALTLAALDPRIGGVLLRGQKGSAKTTLARGLGALLRDGAPFVELPLGATEDRVVGTIDLAAALTDGERRFHPGLLAQVDGGVLYVDEVNLLADHIVDVLLDVAVSGINRVEREGISHEHPSRFVLVGSMNPEEGEVRPQLLDRFGLSVQVAASTEPAERAEAVVRRMAFDESPAGFAARWATAEADLARRIAAWSPATVSRELVVAISAMCADLGVEGMRADLTTTRAAAALAGWEQRAEATPDDVRRVAPLALLHRRRRGPFDDPAYADQELADALESLARRAARETASRKHEGVQPPADERDRSTLDHRGAGANDPPWDDAARGASEEHEDGVRRDDNGRDASGRARSPDRGPDPASRVARVGAGADVGAGSRGDGFEGRDLGGSDAGPAASASAGQDPPPDAVPPRTGGPSRVRFDPPASVPAAPARAMTQVRPDARGTSRTNPNPTGAAPAGAGSAARAPRGRVVGARQVDGPVGSVAVGATIEAAVLRRSGDEGAPHLMVTDVREAVREQRTGTLVVLAVDASGSMGVEHRMAAVKAAALGLLLDAYQRRDRVALVTFGGSGAHVALRPTASVEVARARLAELPTGGRTPLAEGIRAALAVATRTAGGSHHHHRPLLVLVSDGRATAAPNGIDPLDAARAAATEVARADVEAVVIDTESGHTRLGLAAELARHMGGRVVALDDLTGPTLQHAIRELT